MSFNDVHFLKRIKELKESISRLKFDVNRHKDNFDNFRNNDFRALEDDVRGMKDKLDLVLETQRVTQIWQESFLKKILEKQESKFNETKLELQAQAKKDYRKLVAFTGAAGTVAQFLGQMTRSLIIVPIGVVAVSSYVVNTFVFQMGSWNFVGFLWFVGWWILILLQVNFASLIWLIRPYFPKLVASVRY